MKFIQEMLPEVRHRHAKKGVNVAFFPFLRQALIWALKETIGDKMTEDYTKAWDKVYNVISAEIVKAILSLQSTQYTKSPMSRKMTGVAQYS